ncbi:hypothetical protein [Kytococcus sedentarius]|uniref:O-methyltransferase n=1 Tax=Kytococcus sedentarius TaxID=1276 RepID=UPI0038515F23
MWLARAVGAEGRVTTLEVDETAARVSRENFERAGVADRIDLLPGPATESSAGLVRDGVEPYDLVFIDVDTVPTADVDTADLTGTTVGCESTEALWADLDQARQVASRRP